MGSVRRPSPGPTGEGRDAPIADLRTAALGLPHTTHERPSVSTTGAGCCPEAAPARAASDDRVAPTLTRGSSHAHGLRHNGTSKKERRGEAGDVSGGHASLQPDRPAVIMASSGEVLTYGELERRSNKLAHLLRANGLQRLDHFAIFMENHVRYAECCAAGKPRRKQ
jgi:hypothetical protein